MRLFPEPLFQGVESASRMQILHWWEARRLNYNLYLGVVGVATWLLVLFAGSAAVKPGVDFEEPLGMLVGPFVYGFMANLCYTLGSVIDIAIYQRSPRVALFKIGLFCSIGLTALPGLWAVTAWLTTVVTGNKFD